MLAGRREHCTKRIEFILVSCICKRSTSQAGVVTRVVNFLPKIVQSQFLLARRSEHVQVSINIAALKLLASQHMIASFALVQAPSHSDCSLYASSVHFARAP